MFLRRNFNHDRRRRRRQLLNTSVRVFTESGPIEALGINISDVGMSLFTIANLPVHSQIQVEFLAPRSTERTRFWGTVRHRALYLYGIEFLVGSDQHHESRADVQLPDDLTADVASS
jgi:PilZ domain